VCRAENRILTGNAPESFLFVLSISQITKSDDPILCRLCRLVTEKTKGIAALFGATRGKTRRKLKIL
jgi:hypothetical protein